MKWVQIINNYQMSTLEAPRKKQFVLQSFVLQYQFHFLSYVDNILVACIFNFFLTFISA